MSRNKVGRGVLVGGVLVCAGFGLDALVATAEAKGPPAPCPQVYAPVICDNGKIYPNQCEADKKRAKNCVPYPIF